MKYLICLGMSLALAQAASAQDRDGAYMGFSAGSFSYEEEDDEFGTIIDDTTSAFRIVGGYRFNDNFAVEGGWGRTGDLEESFTEFLPPFGNVTLTLTGDYEVLTVRALGFLPFEKVSLVGGGGYYDAEANVSASVVGLGTAVEVSDEGSEDGLTLVGGLEFNLQRIDIRGELEWFDIDDAEAWDVSIGVLYHF